MSEEIGIGAAVAWLPPGRSTVAEAIAAGSIDEPTAARLGYTTLARSDARSAPELAVAAGRKALAEAGWPAEQIDLVVHAWIYHQGHDFWSAPHYIANELGALAAEPLGVHQTSNGAAAAIAVAVSRLAADPGVRRCAVTTADCFAPPAFDRWGADVDVAYGDAGTALLLSREASPYRLVSVASASASRYETLYRGTDPFTPAPRWSQQTISARRTKAAVADGGLMHRFVAAGRRSVHQVIATVLREVELAPDDVRLRMLALPRIGAGALRQFWEPCLHELGLRHVELLDFGRGSGHLGAGDTIANLAEIIAMDRLGPGEVALLLCAGNGYTWSCVAVRRA
ncbi:MAG TPA: 3-oxoacyl-ACP synthase [Micromonosporaceae bacterium]